MSMSVAMDGEVKSLSSWEIYPLESSARSASSSCVSPFRMRSCFNLFPISIIEPFLRKKFSINKLRLLNIIQLWPLMSIDFCGIMC